MPSDHRRLIQYMTAVSPRQDESANLYVQSHTTGFGIANVSGRAHDRVCETGRATFREREHDYANGNAVLSAFVRAQLDVRPKLRS